jgi:hypothetical protein
MFDRGVPVLVPAAPFEHHRRSRDRPLEWPSAMRTHRQIGVRIFQDFLRAAVAGATFVLVKRHCVSLGRCGTAKVGFVQDTDSGDVWRMGGPLWSRRTTHRTENSLMERERGFAVGALYFYAPVGTQEVRNI